jgi:hypothetical protein
MLIGVVCLWAEEKAATLEPEKPCVIRTALSGAGEPGNCDYVPKR